MIPFLLALALSKPVPTYVADVLANWEGMVKVSVVAQDCGNDNAFYYPGSATVVLCTELFDRPELVRFILNHELSHAYAHQSDIPWIDPEASADELAFFMSTEDEVYAGITWFLKLSKQKHHRTYRNGDETWDEHPHPLDRAGSLLCLATARWEPRTASRNCRIYLRSAFAHWLRWVNR